MCIASTYQRTGTLWEGRYKAGLVDSETCLLTCMRCIELNPVRACMVDHPEQYRWSSPAANAQGQPDAVLSPHPLHTALGATAAERQHAYRDLLQHRLEEEFLREIRGALNHKLVVRHSRFKDKIEG